MYAQLSSVKYAETSYRQSKISTTSVLYNEHPQAETKIDVLGTKKQKIIVLKTKQKRQPKATFSSRIKHQRKTRFCLSGVPLPPRTQIPFPNSPGNPHHARRHFPDLSGRQAGVLRERTQRPRRQPRAIFVKPASAVAVAVAEGEAEGARQRHMQICHRRGPVFWGRVKTAVGLTIIPVLVQGAVIQGTNQRSFGAHQDLFGILQVAWLLLAEICRYSAMVLSGGTQVRNENSIIPIEQIPIFTSKIFWGRCNLGFNHQQGPLQRG